MRELCTAFDPLSAFIERHLEGGVAKVAAGKRPALIAAWTTLLRWPDRSQAKSFVEGFDIIGDFEPTNIFRPKPAESVGDLETEFGTLEELWRTALAGLFDG